MNATVYAERRARLAQTIAAQGGGVAVLAAAPERLRNGTAHHAYRHDSHLYYLSGFAEPEALLVLRVPAHGPVEDILFCRPRDAERETWEGRRHGPEAAAPLFAFSAAYPIEEIDQRLPQLLADAGTLYCPLATAGSVQDGFDKRVNDWLATVRGMARSGRQAPARLIELRSLIDDMRLTKDAHEADLMRRAARISAAAHQRAMRACRPGCFEYELEAELLYEFRRQGAQAPAYGSIVAGGAFANILHYVANDQPLRDGELVLIDAACELDGYASDITRTFPVNGRFSGAQRTLYEIVLAAQAAACAQTRPGEHFNAPHEAAVQVLARGLIDVGILQGSVDGVIESGAYRRFYMHRTSHWLGMDVHDVGDYRQPGPAPAEGERPWRTLAPGMVLTLEPGLYVNAADDVPPAFHNIGIRIEDDALVTAAGCELLSSDAPKTIADIEALMRDAAARH